ncbi:exodeoxyribonuclease VII large subunit [Spiroplasma endosymbiont of Crioceris asparagi]|uniref:exodeoxyribonuclease VII large subunit n=1 Tax=Spiroplasma endosymbiont of Crioceris asparagi TaxID=3066286 RepID=UPI0030CED00D
MNNEFITVLELSRILKQKIESIYELKNINVKGEISNLTFSKSGHIYFSLKDNESVISCAIWKSNSAMFKALKPKEGDEIIASGKIGFYHPQNKITFTVSNVILEGKGGWQVLYDEKMQAYEKRGYFDLNNKKPIPKFAKNIGVITAETGDAIKDIIRNIHNRRKGINIFLFPCMVQGENASTEISKRIQEANQFSPKLDIILVGRGGGSYEDLWAFNEDNVVEAVFASKIPIISCVGHENDNTIIDSVADLRASTPTGAAIAATELTDDNLIMILNNLHGSLANDLVRIVDFEKHELLNQIDELNSELENKVNQYKEELNLFNSKLELLNPKEPLKRGYAIVMNLKNEIIDSVEKVYNEKEIKLVFEDGEAIIKVG